VLLAAPRPRERRYSIIGSAVSELHQVNVELLEENRDFKRPFGVEGEVSNGGPAKLGLLIAALSRSGVGVDLLLTSAPPTTPELAAERHD
jgi:hypothetical protein